MVRDELHFTAIAECTDIRSIAGKNTKDGADAFASVFAAADEDRPPSFLHTSCSATDWAIEHSYAALHALHYTFFVYYRQSARLDHDQVRLRFTLSGANWFDFFKNVIECSDRRKRRDQYVSAARDCRARGQTSSADTFQTFTRFRLDIVTNNAVPTIDQGFRHCATHNSETNNSNYRFHLDFFHIHEARVDQVEEPGKRSKRSRIV